MGHDALYAIAPAHDIEDAKSELNARARPARLGEQLVIEIAAPDSPTPLSIRDASSAERRTKRAPIGSLHVPAAQFTRSELPLQISGQPQAVQLRHSARVQAIPARLVPRKSGAFHKQHIKPRSGEQRRQRRPGWPSTHDQHLGLPRPPRPHPHPDRLQRSAQRKPGCGTTSGRSPARSAKARASCMV